MFDWVVGGGRIERLFLARPVRDELLLAALLGGLLLTLLLYARSQGLPRGWRLALAGTRFAVLCALVLLLFEPTASVAWTHSERPRLAVLVDVSESMSIQDQRKRAEDVGEAAAALGLLPAPWEPEEVRRQAMSLAGKQREAITQASRLARRWRC